MMLVVRKSAVAVSGGNACWFTMAVTRRPFCIRTLPLSVIDAGFQSANFISESAARRELWPSGAINTGTGNFTVTKMDLGVYDIAISAKPLDPHPVLRE
jgi:hypothetical protein